MYYIYVIQSIKTKKYYKGLTNDINRRLTEHNSGQTSSNRSMRPFQLIHVEICNTLKEARKLEKFFKSGYGREAIKEIMPRCWN